MNLLQQPDPALQRKIALAQAMSQQGQQQMAQPNRAWQQNAAALANTLLGAFMGKKYQGQQDEANKAFQDKISAAAQTGDMQALAQALGGTDTGIELQVGEMDRQRKEADYQKRRQESMDDKKAFETFKNENNVGQDSMTMKEYNFYQTLPKSKQAEFMSMKRASQIMNLGDTQAVLDPTNPTQTTARFDKGLPPEQTPENKGNQAQAVAEAKNLVEARGNLGAAETNHDQILTAIDDLLAHPGREAATGGSSLFNRFAVPGSDRKDFMVKLDQATGQVFSQAYQMLKGGGQITEYEGQKAAQALANMDVSQSEEQFIQALQDFRYWTEVGFRKMQDKAGVEAPSAPSASIQESANGGQMNRGRNSRVSPKPPVTTIDWKDL